MKLTQITYSLLLMLFFISCQREIDWSSSDNTDDSNISSPLKVSLIGLIVDENGQPLQSVSIKAGAGNSTQTDARGYFRFSNITLDKFKSMVTAEKTGYFKGYRVFSVSDKATNFIKLQLLKRVNVGTIPSATGGQITVGGYSISLPASGVVVKANGATYSGTINVFAQPIDPTVSNIGDIVPGSFLAQDSLSRQGLLDSYAMIAIELQGSAGEALQLAPNKTAMIEFPIPASLQASAPANLPLWYMDESTGIWMQEGRATKNGTTYSGTVKHFSFWNCDVWNGPLVFLEMTIKDMSGMPIPYAGVQIRATNGAGVMAFGKSDSLGYFSGLVPANQGLQLNILNDCHSVAHTRMLTSMNQNTNIGEIRINPGTKGIIVTGNVKDCNAQPITNGMAAVYIDNKYYYLPLNGSGQFSTSILHCLDNLEISVYDFTTSLVRSYQYVIGVDNVTNLQLTTCGGGIAYTVTTYAGMATFGGYVDGPLNIAEFGSLSGICRDQAGNIYVSDYYNNRIRKITPGGIVSTFAGTGIAGFADGPGATAQFYGPSGLAVDNSGNIYVADLSNYRIRKITPAGVVSTFAGSGVQGIANGTSASAWFMGPTSITIDPSGNIYVPDGTIGLIRKITPAGIVSRMTPNGSGYVDGPLAIAKFGGRLYMISDAAGNLYVSDYSNHCIRKISTSGIVSTFAGTGGIAGSADGSATTASFNRPSGIIADANGSLLVLDQDNYKIRKIDVAGNVSTIAGSGIQGFNDGIGLTAQFYSSTQIAAGANGSFYLADFCRIRKLSQ